MLRAVNSSVLSSLVPVVLLIGAGFLAGRRGWIGGGAVRDLSNLIFLLLAPALLFRAMSTVHVEQLSLKPVAAYFLAAGLIFAATLVVRGFNRTAAVLALANTFSNTVMIGIPLIGLAFGPEGMVVVLTLISLHSLVLLTSATLVLELAVAREQARRRPASAAPILRTLGTRLLQRHRPSGAAADHRGPAVRADRLDVARVCRQAASRCWARPSARSRWCMVGITLAFTAIGHQWRAALAQALVKNLAHPALVGWPRLAAGPARLAAAGDGGGRGAADRRQRLPLLAALQDGGGTGDGQRGGVDGAGAGHACRS